jgi:pimeloyl-ACP methyl ester carboxylesterase
MENETEMSVKILWVLAIVAGLVLFMFLSLLLYKIYFERTTAINTSNGISSLEEITLGDVKQWIFIRGRAQTSPILLFLHGGPGAPLFGISSARALDAELIHHFTVVHWDQRGTGKSYDPDIPVKSMTYDRLVEDCNELIDYLRTRFNTEKVFLVGHSVGSIIGLRIAHQYPEKLHAYVGVGQIINEYERQQIWYNFVLEEAEKTGDTKTQNEIKEIGPPPFDTLEQVNKMEEYVSKYGGVIHENSMQLMLAMMLRFFTSPEYSLVEAFNTFILLKGREFTMQAMWEDIRNVNLTQEIQSIQVPLYFFEGQYDMATPIEPVKTFYNSVIAEHGKTLIMFENSGHFLIVEEKEKYHDSLVNVVLKESLNT